MHKSGPAPRLSQGSRTPQKGLGMTEFFVEVHTPSNSSHQGSLRILKKKDGSQFRRQSLREDSKAKKWEKRITDVICTTCAKVSARPDPVIGIMCVGFPVEKV